MGFINKKHDKKERLERMQELYKSITNSNWAALSMEQNGHFKHALISWTDLNSFADEQVEKLNEETANVHLSTDEKIILDELNKLRAEIESNCYASAKAMERHLQLQHQQSQHQQQLQQQHQQHYGNAVPTLRTSIPHTMSSRKPGSKMLKSLRPGGLTSYSSTPSATSMSKQSGVPSASTGSSVSNSLPTAKHAANLMWAPSNSLNVNNSNNNSNSNSISNSNLLAPDSNYTSNSYSNGSVNNNEYQSNSVSATISPAGEFAEFSSTTVATVNTNGHSKKTPSDRARAALKASAAVKYPNRPELSNNSNSSSTNKLDATRQHRSHRSRSPQYEISPNPPSSTSYSPVASESSLQSPTRAIKNPKVPVAAGDEIKADEDPAEDSEEDEDEKILKKIKGVDLKFAKNILVESSRDQDKVFWSDIAGLEQAKETLMETVVYPFLRPDLFRGLREPVSGMLLFGPPGTGKTMLARAAATESNSTFFSIQSSSLTSKWYGESEKLVRALFQVAKAKAPSIIFVDEIDSLLGKRSGDGDDDTSRRLKNEFLVQWSDLSKAAAGRVDDENDPPSRVLVLAATNLPWAVDEAARRRFVRRQYIPLPEPETRLAHFTKLLMHTPNSLTEDDMQQLVELTEGYSGSDITSLAKDAAIWPIRELGSKMLNLKEVEIRPLCLGDFERSMKNIRPSVNKEGLEKFEEWAREFGSSGA
ncbi:hypothetical protein PICMEDRAFT_18080 [Pichia membranifaciens NRRL Y-2026]|uniref:AAA+ ATPase domain-containing protein n=1 Tax=Pichia membranifaciens NRRL Y-2026 TaxID=763406 RepID=A0A1E3NGI0_9ASCO|nr:hypothetical protein PICMEDRAFT_18080 [Pichia membranifaciens NRRL Y-2026]ODQ44678.1 hypothetical protein PICMEDRAFT_18080 [Pichia membranifaciens NRRL Y-2026]